jgi:preprotein translocase subunit SecD
MSGIPGMPGATGTSGTQLARALGLPVTPEADGSVSIALEGAASASSSPPLLARVPMGDDGGSAPSPSAPPTPAPAAPAGAAHPAGPAAPTIDEIYEGVVERLRHDLLIERERMGDLIGGLP